MEFRLLGPLEVYQGEHPVPLGGPRQRTILAHLLIQANRVVPTDRLILEVWGETPPEAVRNSLQSYISHLRKSLGADRIEGRPPGYVLRADPQEVDALRFERLVSEGRRLLPDDPDAAARTLRQALSLWRGEPLADLAGDPSLIREVTRLEELRLAAFEDVLGAELDAGAHAEVVPEAEALLASHPLRERLWGQLMLGLYRTGRQADALAAFRRARLVLAEELGIDPSPELVRLHEQILAQDPALAVPAKRAAGSPEAPRQDAGRPRTAQPVQERKIVSVLFAEISASTETASSLDPEDHLEILQPVLKAMTEEIDRLGGTVERYVGDSVVAVFGVPAAHEDDPIRAVRAALAMQARLATLNREQFGAQGVALSMRVGVNTGDVVATARERPGQWIVTGEAVNVAARLEKEAPPSAILVGERTYRHGRHVFDFRSVGTLTIKALGRPLSAWEVLGERGGKGEPTLRGAPIPGIHAPMVGRDLEIDLLSSLYDRVAAEGRPHLVTILGDPGVGKSRLTAELLGRLETRTSVPTVLQGRCLPYGEGVTYWPLAEILKGLGSVLDTDAPDLVLEKVRKVGMDLIMSSLAADRSRAAAALAFTVGVIDPEVSFSDMDPRQVRSEIHAAWRSFFSGLAVEAPLVVVVEDIHWADPSLLELLEDVTDRMEGPALFVCPARPELTDRRPGWGSEKGNVSSVFLDPLRYEDSERLVGLLLGVEDLPRRLRERILERAEGNPFFLEEIIRQLIDAAVIVREGDRWRAGPAVADVLIPDTIQGVLAARIDLLAPEEKRALQAAAVVGRVFWTGAVAAVVDGEDAPPLTVDDVLELAERRELVISRLTSSVEGQREYIFKHILTRDVAYDSLPRRDRAEAHVRVARWIEEIVGERRSEYVDLLAHHFVEAHRVSAAVGVRPATDVGAATTAGEAIDELRSKAFEYLLLASEDARRRAVLPKAQRLAEQAVEVSSGGLERALALEAAGEAYVSDYEGDLAWKRFTEAIEVRHRAIPDDRQAIASLCARALEVRVRWVAFMTDPLPEEKVRPYMELGLAHAEESDSPVNIRLLTSRAFWPWAFHRSRHMGEAELEASLEAGERAAQMALRLNLTSAASAALDALTGTLYIRGQMGRARQAVERRLELLPAIEDPREFGDIHYTAAMTEFWLGRYRECFSLADKGMRRTPPDVRAAIIGCTAWRAMARFRLGEWDGFFEDLTRCEQLLGERASEPTYFAARPFAAAALVHEARGDRGAADRLLDLVARIDEQQDAAQALDRAPWVAWTLARRRSFQEARARLWHPLLKTWKEHLPTIMEARCDLLADMGAWDEVPAFLDEAHAYTQEAGLVALPFFADRLEGRAAVAQGRLDAARDLLTRAAAGFQSLEAAWEEARTRLFLAEALFASGANAEARSEIDAAYPVFQRLRSLSELARCREVGE